MGKSPLTGLAIVALAAGTGLVAGARPAAAVDAIPIYVNNRTNSVCSDAAGSGTKDRPFCTLSAAVAAAAPGQTVQADGLFNEHVTIAKSGITVKAVRQGDAAVSGPTGGFTIDGQHDVTIVNMILGGATSGAAIAVNNSTHITIQSVNVTLQSGGDAQGIRLTGVTDSLITARVIGPLMPTAITLDAATSGVLIKGGLVNTPTGLGIDVFGSHNTILGNSVIGGVVFEPGATGNTIANSSVDSGRGVGIDNAGATGTAITNNTVQDNCATGIRVRGASSGVSVQNNEVVNNGPQHSGCDTSVTGSVAIGLYDGAAGSTVVDYNDVYNSWDANVYAWNAPMGLAAFRTSSGQAGHDSDSIQPQKVDSANSAAPGYQSTDFYGYPREDDPTVRDIGAGPITYADRGAYEQIRRPTPHLTLTPDHATNTIKADASASTPGNVAIASYAFLLPDGTTATQASPFYTYHFAAPGTYDIQVTVTDVNGFSAYTTAEQSVWPAQRTIALLAHDNNRYVDGSGTLVANQPAITAAELFEVAAIGGGHVALRSRVNGQYLTVEPSAYTLSANTNSTLLQTSQFDLTNNPDGTISLKSVGLGKYVSSNSGNRALSADRTAIGPWEKFSPVDAANASVSLHAHANNKYVTAENGGASPLIANRATAGLWETFDLVDAGGGWVALYSHANGKYVTAENAGASPLIARSTAIGEWERFKVVKNADGSISLQSFANNRYVTAENGGNSSLIANRTAIGLWEAFDR